MSNSVVDNIIAVLDVQYAKYVAGFDKATAAHERFTKSVPKIGAMGGFTQAEAQQYADRHTTIGKAAEDSGEKRKRAAKGASDVEKAEAKSASEAVKKAAKEARDAERAEAKAAASVVRTAEREKQAALKATVREQEAAAKAAAAAAETQRVAAAATVAAVEKELVARARLSEMAQRAVDRQVTSIAPAVNSTLGGTVARETTGQGPIPAATINGTRPAVEREINAELVDRATLQAGLVASTREETVLIRDQLAQMNLIAQYKRAGLTETEATIKAEQALSGIEARRAAIAAETAAAQQASLERQLRAQEGLVASKVSSAGLIGGALVGGLGAAELSHLNDKYIELSNSLKVAGVSASEFDQVQEHLLATANKNGTNINALADVFRSASLASHDLGLSQGDLLKITDAASNSLRIQGVSSEKARGSLLQLGHAFESGRVNAREFNSLALNLYPILQAAAKGSDQFGGSVAKLRAEIVAGTVSSGDFAKAIINGADSLEARASKAALTTAQGFTTLNNALIVYFGQADQAQGVSAVLGAGLASLGQNLDTLIPAIAAIGTALTVGYITRMTAAAIATRGFGAAVLGAFGGPVGLAITAIGLAIAGTVVEVNDARLAVEQAKAQYAALTGQLDETGKAAVGAGGGIKGVGTDALGAIPHVNSFAGAVGNLAQQLYNQARAARAARVESLQGQLQESQKKELGLAAKLPAGLPSNYRRGDFLGNAGIFLSNTANRLTNTLSGGYQDQDNRQALTLQTRNSVILQKQLKDAQSAPITSSDIPGGVGGGTPTDAKTAKALAGLNSKLDGLQLLVGGATGARLDRIKGQIAKTKQKISDIEAGASPAAANAAEGGGTGRRGPSADTLARRAEAARLKGVRDDKAFDGALREAQAGYLSEKASITNDAAAQAEIERERVRFQRDQLNKEIAKKGPGKNGTGEFTAAEVSQLQGINSGTADLKIAGIDKSERMRNADAVRDLDRADLDARREGLQAKQQENLTLEARRRLALEILDLDYQQKAADLRAVLAPDSKASESDKVIAGDRLRALPGQKATDERTINRQNQGAGANYLEGLQLDKPQFIQGEEVKALQAFNSTLDDSVAKALHLHGIFGDIVGDLIDMAIKQAIIKPLANSLFGGEGGGSGKLGGLFKSIGSALHIGGARASGGNVVGGSNYLVGERGPEVVSFGSSGKVYPNGALPSIGSAGGGGTTLHQSFTLDARYGITTPELLQHVNDVASSQAMRAGKASFIAGQRATPGMLAQYDKLGG